jgi:glycosyltransferase involved in cell wall biosynthesis
VSVCIRGSRRETLPRAITSVLDQGRQDIELIVGDDAGDLEAVVRSFGDPRIRYRRNKTTLGLSAHARVLLSQARGRYLCLLDDDDRWLPGFLDEAIARLEHDHEIGIVFTSYFYEAGGRLFERHWPLRGGRKDRFLPTILRGCPIALSVALIRRAVWEEGERLHPIRDDASVDMTMWMRAADQGWAFHFVDARLAVYALHPAQVSHRCELVRERAVRLWESFRFSDPECERLRRRRLAEALLARANLRLRRGQIGSALDDIRAARAASPRWWGERGLVALLGLRPAAALALTNRPRLLGPALRAWRVLERVDRFA